MGEGPPIISIRSTSFPYTSPHLIWPPGTDSPSANLHRPIPKKPTMKSTSRFFTISLVASWYCSNIGVLLLNKYLLSNYGFKYPIFLTMCHMTACSLLSYVAIAWMKMVPMQTIRSKTQFLKISALSLVFCVSVVFGNISLRFLPVSFNQAVGATTPFFTAVFAYLMILKREAWLTYATLVPVVTGVVIASGVSCLFFSYLCQLGVLFPLLVWVSWVFTVIFVFCYVLEVGSLLIGF